MSRPSIQKLLVTFWCLLFAAVPTCACYARFSIAIKREKWTGLAGVVSKEGEQVILPDSLWDIRSAAKPDGDVVIPTPTTPWINRRSSIDEPLAKFDVADPVVLRIRGRNVNFETIGSRSRTIPGDFDGLYLAYSLNDTQQQLMLCKTAGKETEWKVVSAEQALSKSKGEYQYNVTQTVKFRLEAVGHPGWYLDVDANHRLCLTAEDKPKQTIDLEIEKRYDDTSDGK